MVILLTQALELGLGRRLLTTMVFLQALALCGSALLEVEEVLGDGLGLPERVPEVRSLRGGVLGDGLGLPERVPEVRSLRSVPAAGVCGAPAAGCGAPAAALGVRAEVEV